MTPLTPFPTFNLESAATPPAVDSAAASPPAPSAAADISFTELVRRGFDPVQFMDDIEGIPAFLAAPTREYLAAVGRA